MAKPFALDHDKHSHGGYVIARQDIGYVNGKRFVCERDEAVCHVHGKTYVLKSTSHLFVNDRLVALHGDKLACGAAIIATGDHAISF